MISFTIAYPYSSDKKFDYDYYLNTHIPLVREALGDHLKNTYSEKGMMGAGPGTPPEFFMLTHLYVESMFDVMAIAKAAPKLAEDISNFTDVKAIFQVSEVL